MARAGEFKPYNAAFQGLPCGSFVYVIEIGEAVKVGRTTMPNHRFTTLREIHAKTNEAIGRFTLFPVTGDGTHTETRAVRALASVASALPRRREYFTGIDYETALTIVSGVLAG